MDQAISKIKFKSFRQVILVSLLGMVISMLCYFFLDVFLKIPDFKNLSTFAKNICNMFGSTRHTNTAMFNKYSKKHNNDIKVGFIKPSDWRCVSSFHDNTSIIFVSNKCLEFPSLKLHRMAGHHIALLCIIRLNGALQDNVTSIYFNELNVFKEITYALLRDDHWQ